jgi:hypothetical protein
MVLVDILYHVFIIGIIVIGIYYVFSPEQAALSATVALIGGAYFQSIELAYALLILTIPQIIGAIVVGFFLGAWISDD